jgi:hypothetical protein
VSRAKLAALVLSVALLAGCGNSTLNLAARSRLETQWLVNWHATPATVYIAGGPAADRLASRIREAVRASGANLVKLRIYAVPELVPSVTVITPKPARFLRDSLQKIFQSFGGHHEHLLVLDPFGNLLLENLTAGNGGSARVGRGYAGCSPFTDSGLGSRPCREDEWLPFG